MVTKIRRPLYLVFLTVWLIVVLAASRGQTPSAGIELAPVFEDAELREPTFLAVVPDGSGRMLVLERHGLVKAISPEGGDAQVVLDLTGVVSAAEYVEMGLLGLAFAPDFAESGELYLNYTTSDPRRTIVSRFTMDGDTIARDSELVILEQEQPARNHNGGMMLFGPEDGYLYISFGDGGGGGDSFNNGQNLGTILATIIRIDVSNSTESEPYSIPDDNPFVSTPGARGEIWAYGLRNPWRFSIEPGSGTMFSGDVGENNIEEINVIERGGNYGWSIMEGDRCFREAGCDMTGLTPPVFQYTHLEGRCSITGGYTYRGSLAPSLTGAYIYGDYCSGEIWAFRPGEEPVPIFDSQFTVSSFGLDEANEMYVVSLEGRIHRLQEPGAATPTPTPTVPAPTSTAGQTPTATAPGSTPTTAPSATPSATPTPTVEPSNDGGGRGLETTTIVLIGTGVAIAAVAAGAFAFVRFR